MLMLLSNVTSLTTITVGATRHSFKIHRDYLEYYCPTLMTKIQESRKERVGAYSLPKVNRQVFEMFVQWIYRQKIELWGLKSRAERDASEGINEEFLKDEYLNLVGLWIFGGDNSIQRLQNYVITQLIAVQRNISHVAVNSFQYIYANTEVNSKLRKSAVTQCYVHVPEFDFFYLKDKFPNELLLDLAAFSAKLRGANDQGSVKVKAEDYFVSASND